ncbi:MAG: IS5/IS1182 family transposase, partial [candidate division KSB1 bacterium]|nr:IS5/IS1182 family transposase [candidate division KSB1 bacterium]
FGGEVIAIDGSKFSAVNHNGRAYTKNKIALILKEIDEKIDAHLKGLDHQDQVETKIQGLTTEQLQEAIANLKIHRAEVEKIQAQLEASGESQITLTDSDSRLMHSPSKGTDVSYNVQFATDSKHKLIVAHEVTNDCDDSQQLANMAVQAKETLGVESIDATADMGYYNEEEIKKCEDQNITCYVPKPERSRNKKDGLYTKQDFQYDAVNDRYLCPANQELTFRYETIHQGKTLKPGSCTNEHN